MLADFPLREEFPNTAGKESLSFSFSIISHILMDLFSSALPSSWFKTVAYGGGHLCAHLPLRSSSEKREMSFQPLLLATVTNKYPDTTLRILISKKRSLPQVSREICQKAFSHPPFVNEFMRTPVVQKVKLLSADYYRIAYKT